MADMKYFGGNWHQEILDRHRQYGPVVRLSPSEVSFVGKVAAIHHHFFRSANLGYPPGQQRASCPTRSTQKVAGLLGVQAGGATFFGGRLQNQMWRRRERGPPGDGDTMATCWTTSSPKCGNTIDAGAADAARRLASPFALAEKLPFPDACVKEAPRLHPSVLWQLPRGVPPQGLGVRGPLHPPERGRVGQREPAGEGSDEQGVREMNKFDTTNLALVEIYKFTAELLHQFAVQLASREGPWVLRSMWFSDQGEMFVKFKERS